MVNLSNSAVSMQTGKGCVSLYTTYFLGFINKGFEINVIWNHDDWKTESI